MFVGLLSACRVCASKLPRNHLFFLFGGQSYSCVRGHAALLGGSSNCDAAFGEDNIVILARFTPFRIGFRDGRLMDGSSLRSRCLIRRSALRVVRIGGSFKSFFENSNTFLNTFCADRLLRRRWLGPVGGFTRLGGGDRHFLIEGYLRLWE